MALVLAGAIPAAVLASGGGCRLGFVKEDAGARRTHISNARPSTARAGFLWGTGFFAGFWSALLLGCGSARGRAGGCWAKNFYRAVCWEDAWRRRSEAVTARRGGAASLYLAGSYLVSPALVGGGSMGTWIHGNGADGDLKEPLPPPAERGGVLGRVRRLCEAFWSEVEAPLGFEDTSRCDPGTTPAVGWTKDFGFGGTNIRSETPSTVQAGLWGPLLRLGWV